MRKSKRHKILVIHHRFELQIQVTMDYIQIATEGDAVEFGSLGRSTRSCGTSTSSDHGGL